MTARLTSRLTAALVGVIAALLLAQGGPDATLATADTPAPKPGRTPVRIVTPARTPAARLPAPAPLSFLDRSGKPDLVIPRAGAPSIVSAPMPTPGPDTRPLPQGYTVVPFPVPGDSTGAVSERMRVMNTPREGSTLTQPPVPGAVSLSPSDVPEVLQGAAPEYPDSARQAGIQGTVIVRAWVRADGTVGEAAVIQSVPGLDAAALAAVRAYRFRPARGPDGPVAAWVALPIRFTLH